MTGTRKILSCLALLILVGSLVSCGNKEVEGAAADFPTSGEEQTDTTPGLVPEEVEDPAVDQGSQKDKKIVIERIRNITLTPENPYTYDRFTVKAKVFPELSGTETISYIFWINGEKFKEQEENSIPPFSFGKGDSLFVDVILYRGGQELERKRSDVLVVLNSKPEIGEIEFPQIRGVGTYRIVVNAQDADKDPLTFSLAGDPGVPLGMEINQTNGIITYRIDRSPARDVRFRVIVSDGNGGEDWRELFINFTQQRLAGSR